MATPCPTWRPPWWLWARPWATLSGPWGGGSLYFDFFQATENVKITVMSCQVRRGQTPHSWHSCVKTRIFEIFKFVYFHHFELRKMISWRFFPFQGGPRHDQQLPGHEDEVGDAQVALRYRDGGGVIGNGQLESEVRSLLQGENMMNLTFIFAIRTLLNP